MAQTVESSQDRTQVIPLIKLKIAMHKDQCVNEGMRDLHEETRRRVRGRVSIVLGIDYRLGTFSLPEQRARCSEAVLNLGNGQRSVLDRVENPGSRSGVVFASA